MNATIEERLLEVFKKTIEPENGSASAKSDLAALGINSITYVKLVVAIEEEFGFEFDDEDLEVGKFESLNSIISYIENKVQASEG